MFALLAANLISQIGNTFSYLAIPWFVLATTGSASQTGITVAVGTIPLVVVGIFGGTIVDRLGYRRSSIISDLFSGFSVLLIPLLHATVGLAFWQLLVLVFLGAVLDGPGSSARSALYPELVERAGIPLERANGIYYAAGRAAELLGPPLAGILIAAIGPSDLLWINAVSFAISAGIVATVIPTIVNSDAAQQAFRGLRGYVVQVREGFQFLFGNQMLLWLLLSFSIGSLIAEPVYQVVLPVYAKDVLKSSVQLGFIFAAMGAGSLIGNLIFTTIGLRLSRRMILLGGIGIRAATFIVLLTTPPWWVIAAAIFIGSVALEPINPMSMSIMQEQVPPGMRGRVFGARIAIQGGTLPLGILLYGFLIAGIGLHPTLWTLVIANLALPVFMALLPSLRDMRRPEPAPTPTPVATAD
ncbi:MAG TPA: MFS transporter [Thermomicrobiales bacterium]|nr:MFS transporter [Thermomicrobiales bacterium]